MVLKPGLARPGGSPRDPADPGLEPGRVEKKQEKSWSGVTRQNLVKTRLQPIDFFLTKMTPFWIFF